MPQLQKLHPRHHTCCVFLYCRSLTCGFLQHSIIACIYFMPPHGPSRADLALMASLCKHAAVLPVVGKADAMTAHEAAVCCEAVQQMLSRPAEYVPGLRAVTASMCTGWWLQYTR